jgi:hypothetical protein
MDVKNCTNNSSIIVLQCFSLKHIKVRMNLCFYNNKIVKLVIQFQINKRFSFEYLAVNMELNDCLD